MSELGPLLRVALIALGVWVVGVWVVGAGYIAVTYVEAVRYVPRRSLAATVRSMLRELWCILWSQPLMPLFQFAGKRLGDGRGGTPIVLVHGYFQNRVDFLYLAQRLRAAGSGQLYGCNFFWPQRFESSSVNVRDFVEAVRKRTGADRVDLLTHSSGGLLALDLLAERPEWVRRDVRDCDSVARRAVARTGDRAVWHSAEKRLNPTRRAGRPRSPADPFFRSTQRTTT